MSEGGSSSPSNTPIDLDRRSQTGGKFLKRFQRSICLVLLGVPSLDELEKIVNKNKNKKNQKDDKDQKDDKYQKDDKEQKDEEDDPKWPELRKDLTDRTNNVNVVAALVVASAAVFLSAPFPTHISRWDPVFPYFCMLLGFGAAMLAIVSGFVQVVLLSAIGPEDIRVRVVLSYSISSLISADALWLQPTTIVGKQHETDTLAPFLSIRVATQLAASCVIICWHRIHGGYLAR
ncbi:hypothetical protein EDD16DRAFT_1114172 [Pisolithus croceorrhizus]|nr:hypothetical protein EDD16DRAFT_1114172 [Pisolithus croceorrhizus]KAI6146598.1 hypothetical protein EDD17DRAFT_1767603 [Pisolithus thermaeus]